MTCKEKPTTSILIYVINSFSKTTFSSGWCGSVDRVSACKPQGHTQFDSQSGHMPGLQTKSPPGGVQEATSQCISHT